MRHNWPADDKWQKTETTKKTQSQLSLRWGWPYWLPLTLKVIQDRWFAGNLKANMRLPISDQSQPRPYLAPFSHNTSVTDGKQKWQRTDLQAYSLGVGPKMETSRCFTMRWSVVSTVFGKCLRFQSSHWARAMLPSAEVSWHLATTLGTSIWSSSSTSVVVFPSFCVHHHISIECAKKWPNLFLSELRRISTKFDNYWHTDNQDDKIMCGIFIVHLT